MRKKISKRFLRNRLTRLSKQFIISLVLGWSLNKSMLVFQRTRIWPPRSIAAKCWRTIVWVYTLKVPWVRCCVIKIYTTWHWRTKLAEKCTVLHVNAPCSEHLNLTSKHRWTIGLSRELAYAIDIGRLKAHSHSRRCNIKKVPLERNVPLHARKIWQIVISTSVTSP